MVYLRAVTVPCALPRLLRLPAPEGASEFAFLHDIVHAYSHRLYHGYEILSAPPFRVRSIVGRFLEHSRIFFFANGGQPEVYLGSADWMPRNLNERVEVMFRLKDPALCHQVSVRCSRPTLQTQRRPGCFSRTARTQGPIIYAARIGRGTARDSAFRST